jgi:predicted dehydrogenase
MSKLRIGVVGAGGITGAHLPHLQKRSDAVELTAVADVNAEAAASLAKQYGMSFHTTDYRELLSRVDAILVCVPTFLHYEVVMAALEAGVAIFCEKPFTRTLEDAEKLHEAASASRVPVQVGFVRRFDDEWLAWGNEVQNTAVGRPVVWRDVAASVRPGVWFCQDELGGGPFLDGCIHNLDFGLMTFGPAQWVFCHGRTMGEGNTAIDTGTATVRFQSGDELLLAWSWGLRPGCVGARVFEVLGPQGTIQWPRDAPDFAESPRFTINSGESQRDVPFPGDALQQGFIRQMDEFIEVAQGNKKPTVGTKEGVESLRPALAILESARSGEIVRL